MLNSRNYVSEPGVLHVGEDIASETDLQDPETRVYYHQVKGACTHLSDGSAVVFKGGMYATKNPEIIAHLDKIADKRGSQIYTKNNRNIVHEVATVAEDAARPGGDAALTLANAVPTPSAEMIAAVERKPERPVPADTNSAEGEQKNVLRQGVIPARSR